MIGPHSGPYENHSFLRILAPSGCLTNSLILPAGNTGGTMNNELRERCENLARRVLLLKDSL